MDYSAVGSAATSVGDAGNVFLTFSDRMELRNDSNIETHAAHSGGGNIDIQVIDRIVLNSSGIKASAGGEDADDKGGNITIDPVFLILKDSEIVAQATGGDGGAIFLTADNFIPDTNSIIDASSERGNDGEVRITSPDSSVAGSIGTLNAQLVKRESLLRESCAAKALRDRSSLVIEKRSRQRPLPNELKEWGEPSLQQLTSGC
jgi:hypothetical protein